MRTSIRVIPLSELSFRDELLCIQATIGYQKSSGKYSIWESAMLQVMEDFRDNPANFQYADAILLYNRNKTVFLGWALAFCTKNGQRTHVYFFIEKKYRRSGLGTKLYNGVNKRYDKISVSPWNKPSEKFFKQVHKGLTD